MLEHVTALLWILIASASCHGDTLPACRTGRNRFVQLLPLSHCNTTLLRDGRVRAVCKVLIRAPPEHWFIPSDPEIMTLEEVLETDVPANNETLSSGEPMCLSLLSTSVKKWEDFPDNLYDRYDNFVVRDRDTVGPVSMYSVMVFIKNLDMLVSFQKPVSIGATSCSMKGLNETLVCNVYGLIDMFESRDLVRPHSPNASDIERLLALVRDWNLAYAITEKINVTFTEAVKSIPARTMKLFAFFHVCSIVFHECNFKQIKEGDIAHLRYLGRLDFIHVPLTFVHPRAFDLIADLENLSLVGTNLTSIPEAVFSIKNLLSLNMAGTTAPWNMTSLCGGQSLNQNSTAKQVILAGSRIARLSSRAFCSFPALNFLDLSSCSINELQGTPFICLSNLVELCMENNNIAWIGKQAFSGLKTLRVLSLNNNFISTFPDATFFQNLVALSSLSLSHNRIYQLTTIPADEVFIISLDLSNNVISNWTPPFFSSMQSLQSLMLSSNSLYTIESNMLSDVSHVGNVSLCDNPWDCGSCSLKNILMMLKTNAKQNRPCLVCREPEVYNGLKVSEVPWDSNKCAPVDYYVTVGVPFILASLILSLLIHGLYKKRWYIRYALLCLRVKIKNYKRQSSPGTFLWDAFLSYHVSEASWVRSALLTKLETAPMLFRVCVAERDFIPGLPITENICRCISQSRVSLFVLSGEFCRSRWCMFELTMAQHRLFESERDEHIILIKMGDIDECDITPMLSFLMKSRTYIEVPRSGSPAKLFDLFWLQLQIALQK
ncbi:toll-like receptor 6 [Haemaphysalis longicornis]